MGGGLTPILLTGGSGRRVLHLPILWNGAVGPVRLTGLLFVCGVGWGEGGGDGGGAEAAVRD